ncbi:MAG: hypothetical protein R3F49_21495 [Planctomycetota bacterium]
MLLDALLGLAAEREDVRRALTTVNAWFARELGRCAESARAARVGAQELGGAELAGNDPSHGILVPRGGAPAEDTRPVDLERVRLRAAWKGEALRLALAKRAAGTAPGPELRAQEADLRARQSAVGGPWAWMLDAPPARVADQALGNLAQCYEVVARVSEGVLQLEQAESFDPAPPVDLLRLVAETQSSLLAALVVVGLRQDEDQRDLFQWLRERTTRHRIYVDRHMRLEDPADPNAVGDLARRFEEAHERALRLGAGRKQRVQLLNKVRYHVRRLIDGGASSPLEWSALGGALARWREHGLELGDRGLQEVLGALTGMDVPPEAAGGDAGDAHGAALDAALTLARGGDSPRADSVEEVRRLLNGKRALMVGEAPDGAAREALADALGLAHLDWLALPMADSAGAAPAGEVSEGPGSEAGSSQAGSSQAGSASTEARAALIVASLEQARPDVVFMGLRLPQAEYQAFKDRCVELKLPFVRLPGPPSPGAVARQTLRQVGWRLREQAASHGAD